jgi:hypothetical protein
MLNLGNTDFVLAIPSIPEHELSQLSLSLFDLWEKRIEIAVPVPDYSLFLEVENGSIKGSGKILSAVQTTVQAVVLIGGFASGIEYINMSLRFAHRELPSLAGQVFGAPSTNITFKSSKSDINYICNIFESVRKRKLDITVAMAKIQLKFGAEVTSNPEFMKILAEALEACDHYPEQAQFPFTNDHDDLDLKSDSTPDKPRRNKTPIPNFPSQMQIRVEVWRESKNKPKQSRIIKS